MVRLIGVTMSVLLLLAGPAGAQTLTEGSIAIVQPKPVLVQHRVEFIPRFGVTFNDPLISQYHTGVSVYYHISERLHLGGTFEWYDFGGELGGTTGVYDELIRTSSVVPEIAPVTYAATFDVGWVPINGKFTVFDLLIAYYDIYGMLGVGAIETVADPHPAGAIAIGERVFVTDWIAILFEVRDRAYIEPLPSGDTFTNIFSVSLGVGLFVPPSFEYEVEQEPILEWE